MKTFDRENMAENMIIKLGNYLNAPENQDILKEEKVEAGSKAALSMIKWARALHAFFFVNKKVKPK